MLIQLTVGATTSTLVDDQNSAGGGRIAGRLERLDSEALVQIEPLYGAAAPATFARGNTRGQCVLTAQQSFGSYDAATVGYAAAVALVNSVGTVTLQPSPAGAGKTLTLAGAILKSVAKVDWTGVTLSLRYTFEITTINHN